MNKLYRFPEQIDSLGHLYSEKVASSCRGLDSNTSFNLPIVERRTTVDSRGGHVQIRQCKIPIWDIAVALMPHMNT